MSAAEMGQQQRNAAIQHGALPVPQNETLTLSRSRCTVHRTDGQMDSGGSAQSQRPRPRPAALAATEASLGIPCRCLLSAGRSRGMRGAETRMERERQGDGRGRHPVAVVASGPQVEIRCLVSRMQLQQGWHTGSSPRYALVMRATEPLLTMSASMSRTRALMALYSRMSPRPRFISTRCMGGASEMP